MLNEYLDKIGKGKLFNTLDFPVVNQNEKKDTSIIPKKLSKRA